MFEAGHEPIEDSLVTITASALSGHVSQEVDELVGRSQVLMLHKEGPIFVPVVAIANEAKADVLPCFLGEDACEVAHSL